MMTWGRLQALVEALLAGDHTLTVNPEGRVALLQYAYEEIADRADVLYLETDDSTVDKVRKTYNGYYVRRPNLPVDDDATIELDVGLCFAAARLMASYVSKEKFNVHREFALDLINTWNQKIMSLRSDYAELGVGLEKTIILEDQYEQEDM